MKCLLSLLIIINWYIIQVLGVLEWKVIGKVTEYGQDVTLFCNVSHCCPKDAGWDRWTPQQRTLFIDLKTGRPNKKYAGKIYRDGYTLIIKNLTEKDLNVSYSCLYGVKLGERKFLLEEDVFTYISTKQPNDSTGNRTFSEGELTGIIVGVIVLLAVTVVLFYIYYWRLQNICREGPISKEDYSLVGYEDDLKENTGERKPIIDTGERKPIIEKSINLKRMDSTEQGEFMEEIKSGKEVRRYVRVQVIGKHAAGKTSLVRRLLGKNLEEVHSTDGIDITKTCQINTKEDGKWSVCEDGTERKEMIRRLIQTLYKKAEEPISNQPFRSKEHEAINTDKKKSLKNETDDKNKHSYESGDLPPIEVDKVRDEVSTLNAVPTNVNDRQNTNDISATSNEKILNKTDGTLSEVRPILENSKIDANKSEKMSLTDENYKTKIPEKKMKEIFGELDDVLALVKQEKDAMASEGLVECGIWDFAGEKDYYVTHQTFMTQHAIYILVTSLKGNENKLTEEHFDDIAEYIDFWFNSIHCFCENTSQHANKLDPPVIMVFTHTDEWMKSLGKKTEKEIKTLKEDYFYEITTKIGKISNHMRNIFFLSNTQFGDEDRDTIDLLKKSISDTAKDMKYFAEQVPLEWIKLENALAVLKKDLQTKVLSWDDIYDLAGKTINGKIDIIAFLKSQHKIGNIVFFEDIKEYIILQPNWLVDCFKCLICDDNKLNIKLLQTTEMIELANTGCISNDMITKLFEKQPDVKFEIYQDHILKVMQKFDIIVKPKFKGTLNNVCQQSNSYYMPCMIRKTETLENIKKIFGDGCSASPWLTFEFEFLPLAYFNHILVHFMNEYIVCVEEDGEKRKAIFKGKAVFFLDKTRFERLILCFSKNAISLQIWKLDEFDENIYQLVLKNLRNKIKELNNQLRLKVTYKIKAKCSTGDYSKISGRLGFADLIERCKDGNYILEDSTVLSTDELVNTWLKPTIETACDQLEIIIDELVAEGKHILSMEEVEELNKISIVRILSPDQLRNFLHSQHILGKIVYFDVPHLRYCVIINSLLLEEVKKSFVTDVAFWQREEETRKTFMEMSEIGMLRRNDIYQIWEQEEFRQILQFKKYIFDMLLHLDIVSEQRRYDTTTGSRLPVEHFFVPCMLTQRNNTDYLTQECTPERTVSLAFVFKGTIIPPDLPNRLICACLSMWTLKEYHGRKLMFSGFVGLSVDKGHDIVVCVEGNKILLYLVHNRSKGLIIPDIATSVRDCLLVTLERISEFYQSTIHCKANNKLPFHTEYSCSKLNCFTPEENIVVNTEKCLCEHGENIKYNWRVWNQKLEQMQCDLSCPGLSEYSLDQIPSNPELLRLSGNCNEDLIHELALRLGMEEMDWRDICKNYTGNTQMVKFLTLIHLKENYSICFGDLDRSLQEMKITTHTLCMVRRRKQVKSRIPDEILDCIPTDEILDKLAPQIGKMGFQLGTELGLSIKDLENIDKCSPNLIAQNKEVLFTWRKDRSVRPTIRVIKQALVNIRKGVRCLEEVVKNIDAKTLRAVEIVTDKIRDRIIESICISQILDHMMTHLVISADDRLDIEHYPRYDDQIKALLDIVIKRREPTYSVFVDGLHNYGYTDIANEMKCDIQETSPSTTLVSAENEGLKVWNVPLYKVRLQKNYEKVIINIQHESIVDHLISRKVVSVDDRKRIKSGKSIMQKNRNLMDMLLRKNEQGFNEFLKALRKDSMCADLAEEIEKTEVTSTDMATLHKCLK